MDFFFEHVLLPLVVNLGSNALTESWATMRARGRGWERRLAKRLEIAGGGVFSRGVLQEWLTEPNTIPRLARADATSTFQATNDLAAKVEGSQVVGPTRAARAAEAVVAAAYLAVLEEAPDPQGRLTAWAVRQLGLQGEQVAQTLALLNDVAKAQNLQDGDLLRMKGLIEELHAKVMIDRRGEDGDVDVLVADDTPWTVGGLVEELQIQGMSVATAQTVAEAEKILRSRNVAVAVVDLLMPSFAPDGLLSGDDIARRTMSQLGSEIGGMRLVRHLHEWSPATAIVVWSAVADTREAELRDQFPDIAICDKFADHRVVLTAIKSALGRS